MKFKSIMSEGKQISPWLWVPTLYFAEGIPYFIVNQISVVIFTGMGVPNDQMAFFTSLIYLPWVIKPLWSPFVDIIRTKRWWIILMQLIMSAAMILTIISIPHPTPEMIATQSTPITMFTVVLILFIITAFASATHDIAADGFYMLALTQNKQAAFIGARSVFYRFSNVFCNSIVVFIAGVLTTKLGDISAAWQITMIVVAVLFTALSIYHTFFVPRPADDKPLKTDNPLDVEDVLKDVMGLLIFVIKQPWVWFIATLFILFDIAKKHIDLANSPVYIIALGLCVLMMLAFMVIKPRQKVHSDVGRTFVSFFQKPVVWLAIVFMLLYRLPEAFLLKLIYPFMHDPIEAGGLAMTDTQFATIYGFVGVIFLLLGGVLGGVFASKVGLKKAFWWMAACMTLPCLSFVYLSSYMPANETLDAFANTGFFQTLNNWDGLHIGHNYYCFNINGGIFKEIIVALAVAVEQFGYGFGFTAYMLYMMYFSEGELKTAHYAICTAFMSMSMMIPGMVAGKIQMEIGYSAFFWMVIACCAATLIVTFFVQRKVDAHYGKK